MQIIAALRDENDILMEERARLSAWAPSNGWLYVEYVEALDLVARLGDLQRATRQQISEIEIVAHGNPAICNDIALGNAAIVAESLRRLPGIAKTTEVYLSGCNTGLEFNGECIALSFAASFEGSVFGTCGYFRGSHAERTEHCVASFVFEGIVYHSYPGGIDAVGGQVWRRFGPVSDSSQW